MKKCTRLASLSIKYKVIVPVVIMLMLSCVVAGLSVYKSITVSDEQEIRKTLDNIQLVAVQRMAEAETAAGMLTDNLANNNDVQFSIALKDKGLLGQNVAPIIKSLKNDSFLSGYFDFTDPNGTVIYASSHDWLISKHIASSRPLLKKVMEEHKKVSGLEAGPDGLYVRAISPVMYNGQFAGAIGFNVSLESIFRKVTGRSANLEIALLVPVDMLSARHDSDTAQKIGDMAVAYHTGADMFEAMKSVLKPDDLNPSDLKSGTVIFHFFPVKLAGTTQSVTGVLAYDSKARMQAVSDALKRLWIILGVSTLVISVLMILFLSRIISPVHYLVTGMKALSRGQFTEPVPRMTCNEFGALARLSNNILFSFGHLIKTIQHDAENLTTAAGVIKAAGTKFRQDITELDKESDRLATRSEQVSQRFQDTSRAMDDLSTASSEIAASVANSAASASETLEVAMVANDVIKSLGENSNKIGEIVQVIDAVARQTNLLALNATIEAARAGEAGKGFAVVANEVKELAKQTGEATEEIARMIEAIQADTSRAVSAVRDIGDKIQNVTDMTNTIASATEEQTATISEISTTLEAGMQDVMSLADMAESLKTATLRFSENVVRTTGSQEAIGELADELQIVARYFSVSDKAIHAVSEDVDEKVKLLSVTLQHFIWKQALTLAILSGTPVDIELDPEQCVVGKFVAERLSVADTEELSLMQEIEERHGHLHQLGQQAMEMLRSGKQDQARSLFKEQLRPQFNRMLELLERAKGITMQQHDAGMYK